MKECLTPAKNKELNENGHCEMSFGEFLGWLGCCFIGKVHPGHFSSDLFSTKPRNKFWNLPCLGDAMSDKRFERINACLKLDDEEKAPEHKDRLFWIIKLSKCFNDNMAAEFDPSQLVYID